MRHWKKQAEEINSIYRMTGLCKKQVVEYCLNLD